MKKDEFGDRMKAYERVETDRCLPRCNPIYARLDGRGFSKFTKGMDRPFDIYMSDIMMRVTATLVEQTNAVMGYTQSDEISLAWPALTEESQMMFDSKIMKLTSILSGIATSAFMYQLSQSSEKMSDRMKLLPHFDCRIFSLPSEEEVANAFLWREQDATKNAISMVASHYFSHKELQSVSGPDRKAMLRSQAGIEFNDYPAFFKRGQFIARRTKEVLLSELWGDNPYRVVLDNDDPNFTVLRSRTVYLEMPPFREVKNRAGVIFRAEEPVTEMVVA